MQPQLFAEMGFNAWFFARLDHEDKDLRIKEKRMEHLQINKRAQNIFTHVMKSHYRSPPTFEFDNPQDNPPIDDSNIKKRSDDFVSYLNDFRKAYNQDFVMHPIGCDFTYQDAPQNFNNWDKLIKYINANEAYNTTLLYSRPSDYLQKVHALNLTYTTKEDDFLPYSDGPDAFWAGFYTSRPLEKLRIR